MKDLILLPSNAARRISTHLQEVQRMLVWMGTNDADSKSAIRLGEEGRARLIEDLEDDLDVMRSFDSGEYGYA